MVPYIIGGIIIIYVAFVIVKRVKAIKAGHFCNCGCDSCPSKCKPVESKKKEI